MGPSNTGEQIPHKDIWIYLAQMLLLSTKEVFFQCPPAEYSLALLRDANAHNSGRPTSKRKKGVLFSALFWALGIALRITCHSVSSQTIIHCPVLYQTFRIYLWSCEVCVDGVNRLVLKSYLWILRYAVHFLFLFALPSSKRKKDWTNLCTPPHQLHAITTYLKTFSERANF